jgi:hypothetical protein
LVSELIQATNGLMAAGLAATITQLVPVGANGKTRLNAANGKTQRFRGGCWLDVLQIDLGLAGCQAASDGLPCGRRVTVPISRLPTRKPKQAAPRPTAAPCFGQNNTQLTVGWAVRSGVREFCDAAQMGFSAD